jgi:MtrB/PioB family decaheme-associated outer membrane protein
MNIKRSLKATLAASVCLLPLQALAQSSDSDAFDVSDKPAAAAAPAPTNWISIGGDYQSTRSDYFNRFRGGVNPGLHGLWDFQARGRDAWDSGGTRYWELQGNDLGYEDRSFMARFGDQGSWGLGFSYDGIPYNATDTFHSIWQRSGALVPGVAPGSLGLGSGIAFRNLAPATTLGSPYLGSVTGPAIWTPQFTGSSPGSQLYNYHIGTQRDVFTGTGKWQWNDWTITGSMRHEHKTGYLANSLNVTGTPSPTSSSAAAPTTFTSALGYFAQPIDYDTDRYDIMAAYSAPRFQAQVAYVFNNFTDNIASFNAVNPYAFTGASFGSPAGMFAPYSLPPSNSAHQLKLMAGYNITPTTRINANFAYGLQMQNDTFDTATGNPAAALSGHPAGSSANLAEPRASLNGLVQTFFGNIAATAQPMPKLDLRLSYTIDDRDNQTPRNQYLEDHNTTATVSAATLGNLPFSFMHQTMTAEAGYRILPQTKVTLNETYEIVNRTYADTSLETTNTVTAKVRSQVITDVFASLSYSHQNRDAHNYTNNLTWILFGDSARDPGALAGQSFLMYFETSRVHDEVKSTLDFSPINSVNATLMAKFANDTYPDGQYGLRNNHNISVGPDVNWQVTPTLSAHAFYTYQQLYYAQNSIYQSTTAAPPSATQYQVPWSNKTTDSVHTAGVTLDWQAIPEVLKVSLDYNFAYGDTAYAMGDSVVFFGASVSGSQLTAANINLQPLPDVKSMLNMISVRGEYTFRPNMTLIFGYAFERFNYKDFMNGTSSTQYANILLPGTPNPNEAIHVVGAGLRFRF